MKHGNTQKRATMSDDPGAMLEGMQAAVDFSQAKAGKAKGQILDEQQKQILGQVMKEVRSFESFAAAGQHLEALDAVLDDTATAEQTAQIGSVLDQLLKNGSLTQDGIRILTPVRAALEAAD